MGNIKELVQKVSELKPNEVSTFLGAINPAGPGQSIASALSTDPVLVELVKRVFSGETFAGLFLDAVRDETARVGQEALDNLNREREEIAAALRDGNFAE